MKPFELCKKLRMTPKQVQKLIIKKFESGQTMKSIAKELGVSRINISLYLKRYRNQEKLLSKEAILRENGKHTSTYNMATKLNSSARTLVNSALTHHVKLKIIDLIEIRRRKLRIEYVSQIKVLASKLGRTPTQEEIMKHHILPKSLVTLFGSYKKAILACGLAPNSVGNAEFLKKWRKNEAIG